MYAIRSYYAPGNTSGGYSFVELLVVTTIILILASAIMPLAKVTVTRQREADLRRTLRELRTAIDRYKDAADLGEISPLELEPGNEGYPPDLVITSYSIHYTKLYEFAHCAADISALSAIDNGGNISGFEALIDVRNDQLQIKPFCGIEVEIKGNRNKITVAAGTVITRFIIDLV